MPNVFHTCCKCGCGNGFLVSLLFDDEEDYVTISTTTSGFMAMQGGIWETIARRIKSAWFMLRGKQFYLHDVILDKSEWKQFVKFINLIEKNNKEQEND